MKRYFENGLLQIVDLSYPSSLKSLNLYEIRACLHLTVTLKVNSKRSPVFEHLHLFSFQYANDPDHPTRDPKGSAAQGYVELIFYKIT